jgi:hypothetical protein
VAEQQQSKFRIQDDPSVIETYGLIEEPRSKVSLNASIDAPWLALPLRPLVRLAQDEESRRACSEDWAR